MSVLIVALKYGSTTGSLFCFVELMKLVVYGY